MELLPKTNSIFPLSALQCWWLVILQCLNIRSKRVTIILKFITWCPPFCRGIDNVGEPGFFWGSDTQWHPPGSAAHWGAGTTVLVTHRSVRKRILILGQKNVATFFIQLKQWCFPPRKARKTWRVWLNMCTFSHWVVYIYKNATSRQALSILCWLIQNIMKNHFKLGHEDLLALPVFYIPQRYQPLGHVHTSEKREAVNSLVELKHC